MAEASFVTESKSVTEMVPVTKIVQTNKGVTLHLTLEEAQLILEYTGSTVGADSGARGLSNKIYAVLTQLGFSYFPIQKIANDTNIHLNDQSLNYIKGYVTDMRKAVK